VFGSDELIATALAAVVALRLLIPMFPKRSSACFRSDSCSVRRRRSRLVAASSSLLSSLLSSASLRAFSACRSAIRCAFVFLFAFSSASCLAFFSAATLAFSRSTSESSAASQLSRTCFQISTHTRIHQSCCRTYIAIILFLVVELATSGDCGSGRG
jgi:hypothetical protein